MPLGQNPDPIDESPIVYPTQAELLASAGAFPGQLGIAADTQNCYVWDEVTTTWVIKAGGTGDMLAAIYDPNTVGGDAFDSVNTAYTPGAPGDWPDPDPTHVNGALDDLAHRILETGELSAAAFLSRTIPNTDVSPSELRAVIGAKESRLVAVTVDGVTPQNHLDSNRGSILANITTLTAGGTLRLTGTSYNPSTGTATPADTEDIAVAATGYYSSTKQWQGTVVLSSVGGLDVVLSSFFWVNELKNSGLNHLTIKRIDTIWLTTAPTSNLVRIVAEKFDPAARTLTVALDHSFGSLSDGTTARNVRDSLSIAADVTLGEEIHLYLEIRKVTNLSVVVGAESV
jgi:hypothetical protein